MTPFEDIALMFGYVFGLLGLFVLIQLLWPGRQEEAEVPAR